MKINKTQMVITTMIVTLLVIINLEAGLDYFRPGFEELPYHHDTAPLAHPAKKYNIAIDIRPNPSYLSNKQLASRLKVAAENLGWQVHLIDVVDFFGSKERQAKLARLAPDFMLTLGYNEYIEQEKLSPYAVNFEPTSFNKYALLDSKGLYFKKSTYYNKYFITGLFNEWLYKFDGYLYSFDNPSILEQYVSSKGRKFHGASFYPSVQAVKPEIPLEKFRNPTLFYSTLHMHGFADSSILPLEFDPDLAINYYGPYQQFKSLEKAWRGEIPYDGTELITLVSKYAAVLVLADHPRDTGAIKAVLEAAAAGSIIISGHNDFVDKHFKDQVLYVDQHASTKHIAKEVQQHLKWIKEHPEQAKQLADSAHYIFSAHFSLEQQLTSLETLHEDATKGKSK